MGLRLTHNGSRSWSQSGSPAAPAMWQVVSEWRPGAFVARGTHSPPNCPIVQGSIVVVVVDLAIVCRCLLAVGCWPVALPFSQQLGNIQLRVVCNNKDDKFLVICNFNAKTRSLLASS